MSIKLIIHIEDGISTAVAIDKVQRVINGGRVSYERGRNTFCFHTRFEDGICVNSKATTTTTDTMKVFRAGGKSDG